VSNFQWKWRYSCLNVTHKKPYKCMKERQMTYWLHLLVIINYLNKFQQFILSVQKPHHRLQCTFQTLLATVGVALLRSSWRSCFMRAALFIMRATNSSLMFTLSSYTSLYFHPHRQKSDLHAPTSNSCIIIPIAIWTHVYVSLLTRNTPYYQLLKYLLFLLKHPV